MSTNDKQQQQQQSKKKHYEPPVRACVDGNWAVAHAAYRINDCAFIFPITPSSPMGEYSDEFATKHKLNIYGQEMKIVEMQSEAGAGTCFVFLVCLVSFFSLLSAVIRTSRGKEKKPIACVRVLYPQLIAGPTLAHSPPALFSPVPHSFLPIIATRP